MANVSPADPDRSSSSAPDGRHGSAPDETIESRAPLTKTSTSIVLVVSLAVAALLMTRVGPSLSVVIAFGDAVLFAASLWLVDRDHWRVVGIAAAGLLALFVGVGFVGAVGYAALQLLGDVFPVTDVSLIRPQGLEVLTVTLVVVGGTVAMIGGVATVGNVLRSKTVWAHAHLSVKTFVVPLVVATLLLFSHILRTDDVSAAPVFSPVADTIDGGVSALLSPMPGRAHVFTFCALLFGTALAVRLATDTLPVAQLSTARDDDGIESIATSVRTVARYTTLGLGAFLPLTLVEVALPPAEIESVVTPAVYALAAAVTGSHGLRLLLGFVFVLSAAVFLVSRFLQWVIRTEMRDVAVELMPFVGGAGVVGVVAVVHGAVLQPTIDFVASRLPTLFGASFARQSNAVVEFYGSMTVTMTIATMLVGLTALLSLGIAVVASGGLLPEDVAGPALASGGIFVAAAFAGGVGVNPPLVLGGLVASMLVWHAGEYGLTLGREVGEWGAARDAEFVSAGATVVVGTLGALAALLVYEHGPGVSVSQLSTLAVAVGAIVAGLFLIVAALR